MGQRRWLLTPLPNGYLSAIEPCLPSSAKAPPSGNGWLHVIKHDGFRILARRDSAGVRLFTRNGHDFTYRFPLAAAAVAALPGRLFLIGRRSCLEVAPFPCN
jgi:bifunctional non-homologous end joining protein LigD